METRSTRHSRYHIYYHLVWIPKYRRQVLTENVKQRLIPIFQQIAESHGFEICEIQIMPDHVHAFVSAPPKQSPSLIINWLKGISSRIYNHTYKDGRIRWTNAYYVGTAGTVSKQTILKYIQEQTKCRDTSVGSHE